MQTQLQKVQLERTTLTNKLKASETEITSLQNVRQWYQQQLVLAQEARVRLQSEMANIQVLYMGELRICSFLSVLTTGQPSDVLQWPDCTSAMKVVAEIRHTQFQHDFFFSETLKFCWYQSVIFFPSFRLGK